MEICFFAQEKRPNPPKDAAGKLRGIMRQTGHAGPELRHFSVIEDKCSHSLPVTQTRPEAEQRFSYWPILSGKKVTSAKPEESSMVTKPIIRPSLVLALRAVAIQPATVTSLVMNWPSLAAGVCLMKVDSRAGEHK